MKSILSKLLVFQILGCLVGIGILYSLLDHTLTQDEQIQFYNHGQSVAEVHIEISPDDFVGVVKHTEHVALGSLIAVFLALIFVFSFFTRHIIARIHQLTQAAGELAEDVRVEVPQLRVHANDEIGVLTVAFNRMANDIRQSRDRLEARVAERTAALAAANAGLQNEILERQNAEQALREGEAQLQHLALHDPMTGLPNRLLFQDRLRGALLRAQRSQTGIAVMFVDLDNFKVINDSMGHEAGDTLLKTISLYLQSVVRAEDTTARLGGDEFTLLLEGLRDVTEATQIAERITSQLEQPIRIGEREIFASASIGIVYHSAMNNTTCESLLRDADTAMYHAKANGKSGYALFDSDMNANAVERLEIETGLRFAIDREELRLHYQPLIDLSSGHMIGIEALVRWQHPIHGLIAPGKFIPLAEETGLIIPIGYWVLEAACRQLQRWRVAYPHYHALEISVNFSGKQLQRPDAVERVRTIIEQTGITPQHLKLEITESVMMADVEETLAKLHQLKAIGVKLAMDDFGTGYSSMSSLNLLPLDTIKIDRSFIRHITDQEETRSIIIAIIMLSNALHLNITGEGVETIAQVAYLQGVGCHVAQGYYFSKPLASTDLEALMSSGEALFNTATQDWSRAQIEKFLAA